ncbi:MAG: PHP domain-containing protein [bacterium]
MADATTGGCDLHIHSEYSDGSCSPAEIVERAVQANLEAIALTDHDTVDGVEPFMNAARDAPLEPVPGVELSCHTKSGRYHVLGYFIDWENSVLVKKLKYYEEARADRVRGMVDVLNDISDMKFTFEEIAERAGQSLIGKPHVAQVMVDRGFVDNVTQAFEEYLASGNVLDEVPKERMGVSEAIQLIDEVGGIPILAHPVHYEEDLDLQRFKQLGIEGLEVFYSDHDSSNVEYYREKADQFDWLITGGSDFHGDVKPTVNLGDVRMPLTHLDSLRTYCRQTGARHDLYSLDR